MTTIFITYYNLYCYYLVTNCSLKISQYDANILQTVAALMMCKTKQSSRKPWIARLKKNELLWCYLNNCCLLFCISKVQNFFRWMRNIKSIFVGSLKLVWMHCILVDLSLILLLENNYCIKIVKSRIGCSDDSCLGFSIRAW